MIVMGRVTAPFGVKGWVKIVPFSEKVDGLFQYSKWWLFATNGWYEVKVDEKAVHRDALLVRFAGVHDRDQARDLKGRDVAIPRGHLPELEDGEYYWSDLVGLKVENMRGQQLGSVERLFESGANPVLVVAGERERLLPYIETVVKTVDLEAGTLLVDWELDY